MPVNLSSSVVKRVVPLAALIGIGGFLYYLWSRPAKVLLEKLRKRVKVLEIIQISHDTKKIRLSTGHRDTKLGLPIGKHIRLYAPNPQKCLTSGKWNGKDDPDKGEIEIERSYTPTPSEDKGFLELVIKIYRPGIVSMPDGRSMTWEDGGKMGLHLDSLKVGSEIELYGPVGLIEYLGKGTFKMPGLRRHTKHVGMMAGGTGITPMLQVVHAALQDEEDTTQFSLIYANKTQDDILCGDILTDLEQHSRGRFKVHFTLDFPPDNWTHKKGFITADMIKECLPSPSEKPLVYMCGPPPMVEFACKKNLEALGYEKNSYHAF